MAQLFRRLEYRLVFSDALAWTTRKRELTGGATFAMILWFASAGFVVAFVPDDWSAVLQATAWLAVVALWYGLYSAVMTLAAYRKARRLLPVDTQVVLDVLDDRITAVAGGSDVTIGFDEIGAVGLTPAHLFVQSASDVVIIPASAFESSAEMADLAARLDEASNAAQP